MKKSVKAILILLTMVLLGTVIQNILNSPIPDIFISMFIFFIVLYFNIIEVEEMESVTAPLLAFMGFYFVPALVGLVEVLEKVMADLVPILLLIIITTTITYFAIGFVITFMMRRDNE